jgi:hypothetical protein
MLCGGWNCCKIVPFLQTKNKGKTEVLFFLVPSCGNTGTFLPLMWRFSMQVNNSSWQSKKLAQISLTKRIRFTQQVFVNAVFQI